jgi:hypothetical protein
MTVLFAVGAIAVTIFEIDSIVLDRFSAKLVDDPRVNGRGQSPGEAENFH